MGCLKGTWIGGGLGGRRGNCMSNSIKQVCGSIGLVTYMILLGEHHQTIHGYSLSSQS